MAKPHVEVFIDWDAASPPGFLATEDDVSADVKMLDISHTRDMATERMNGRELSMELRNDGTTGTVHRYSPPKAGPGVLSIANKIPGRPIWARLWYPYDTFTGTNGTQLTAHTPDEDSDWPWVEAIQNWDLDGNGNAQTDSTQGNGDCVATMEFNDTDVTIAANIEFNVDTDYPGLCVRYVDASNYAYVRFDGTNVELRKVIAGTDTQVATDTMHTTWSTGITKLVVVRTHGIDLQVFIDGIVDLDTILDDAAINSGTRFGLFADDEGDHQWANFGGFKSVFWGRLDSIKARKVGAEYVSIRAQDAFEQFKRDKLQFANTLATSGTRTIDQSLGEILDAIGYETGNLTGKRLLDSGKTVIRDTDEGLKSLTDDALAELYQLQDEEDGFIYVDGAGFLVFEGEVHRSSVAPHSTSLATFKDTYDGTNPAFTDIDWDDGQDYVENLIIAKYQAAVKAATADVWTHPEAITTGSGSTLSIGASATIEIVIEIDSQYDAADGWVTPVATTDYTANAAADGTGTDRTASITASFQETDKYAGKHRKLRLVNAFAGTVYVTLLKVRADPRTKLNDPSFEDERDSTSVTDYGERRREIVCKHIHRRADANTLVTSIEPRRDTPKTVVDITLEAGDKATLHHMIQRRISDRVTLNYADMMDATEDFFVEGESWQISEGGTRVRCVLQLREV